MSLDFETIAGVLGRKVAVDRGKAAAVAEAAGRHVDLEEIGLPGMIAGAKRPIGSLLSGV